MELDNIAGRHFECEVCGLKVMLTDHIAYELGWDYPPFMGAWGIIGPRTCGNCGVEDTAWWQLAVEKKSVQELSDHHYATVLRIVDERPPAPPA